MVVVVNVTIDRLNQLSNGIKSVDIAWLVLEVSIERLNIAILPGRCHVTDRNLYPPVFEIIGAALGHEFSALIGVKDQRRDTRSECLAQSR